MPDADKKRDPNHSDDDVALKRDRYLELLRDEAQVALDNVSPDSNSRVRNAIEDLVDALDDAIDKQTGPSKAEVEEQQEREDELKKPQ